MKINWLMVLPFALTAGFFGIAGYQLMTNQNALQQGVDTQALPSAQQGRTAPNLDLQPLGQSALLTRADLEGNGLIVVNFFASWCPPCRAEHPTLTALAEAGVPLYGVNYRDRIDQALGFLDELGNPYDLIGRDEQARNGADWGVVAMPETFFIDDSGTVVLHFRGPVTERSLQAQIRPALAAVGHSLPELQGSAAPSDY
jgi:cytochrome c biogenesis protein CcmG/thiol:disulfide interchange protein DsbE